MNSGERVEPVRWSRHFNGSRSGPWAAAGWEVDSLTNQKMFEELRISLHRTAFVRL